MVNKIDLSAVERFNELGRLVNGNFQNLFDLASLIGSKADDVYGYYDDNFLVGFIHVSKSFETLEIVNIAIEKNINLI